MFFLSSRDGIGDMSVLGDPRWGGGYGVDADFVAMENTHVAFVSTDDIKALAPPISIFNTFNLVFLCHGVCACACACVCLFVCVHILLYYTAIPFCTQSTPAKVHTGTAHHSIYFIFDLFSAPLLSVSSNLK